MWYKYIIYTQYVCHIAGVYSNKQNEKYLQLRDRFSKKQRNSNAQMKYSNIGNQTKYVFWITR